MCLWCSCDSEADPTIPQSSEGNFDWYCWRAWVEHSAEVGDRDKAKFLEDIGEDKVKLNEFLQVRMGVIERTKQTINKKREKRRGASPATGEKETLFSNDPDTLGDTFFYG